MGESLTMIGLCTETESTQERMIVKDAKGSNFKSYLYEYKPVLRPLSDLTKKIDYGNGAPVKMIETFFREPRQLLEKELKITNGQLIYDYLTWEILRKLFKYHFDVFGLIENDLAIDINTLK